MTNHQHHALTADRRLYRQTAPAEERLPQHVRLCSCEPALSCPEGGVMVRSGLRGVLTPLYSRMQNGWCCRTT